MPAIGDSLGQIGLGWADVSHVVATHDTPTTSGVGRRHDGGGWSRRVCRPCSTDRHLVPTPADRPWGDGDTVFDLRVIATPGHTPGHISLLDESAGILVAGESANGTDGTGLTGANPQYTPDMATANESIAKMAGFDYWWCWSATANRSPRTDHR